MVSSLSPVSDIQYAWHSYVCTLPLDIRATQVPPLWVLVALTPWLAIALGALDNIKAKLKAAFKKKSDPKPEAAKPAETSENKTDAAKPVEGAAPAEAVPATTTDVTAAATETKPDAPVPAGKLCDIVFHLPVLLLYWISF